MSTTTFEHLLRPGRLGPLQLSSRIVLPAMDMNHCDDGVITDAEIAHYRARAAGGAALVITGSGAVSFPIGAASRKQPGLSDDRFVPGLARLADAVHEAGALLCVQLTHHGKTARVDIAEDRPVLVPSCPVGKPDLSALRDNTADELRRLAASTGGKLPTYREADEDDIAWLIEEFAAAARRVRDAGADAVEVHAAHGYVLSTFLARADNRRHDRWGGSLENRARLTVEVLQAVHAAAGPDMAVLVRVSGREFGEDGALTLDESVTAVRMFAEAGADAVHVTGWGRNSFGNFTDGPLPDTVGAYRADAKAVRAAVDVPVIAVGRLLPEVAEEMVAGGECDFVAMGRQLLTDPDLVAKLRAGRRASVRPCINCYVCVEQNFYDDPPRCAVNPALGHEDLALMPAVREPKHVVVVGAGPAGMETARIASERGHRVTLLEAAHRLGGTAWFSQLTTPANGPLVEWQARELSRLGVSVRIGATATADEIVRLAPDAVVVATGASRGLPPVPGADLPHVWSGDSLRAAMTGSGPVPAARRGVRLVLRAAHALRATTSAARVRSLSRWWLPLGRRVVVLGGGLVGLELAEFLAERRRSVTVLEPGPAAGLPMAGPRRWTRVRSATSHGVDIVRQATVIEITAEDVVYDVGGERCRARADAVVVAGEVRAGAPLADMLDARGVEVHVVGDAGEVGYIEGAIHSAWRVARAI
jgi:2,4-dienoyl-CoA reductase-like NADH-dependent reductase (Old Yellow Enzyme family)